MCSRKTDAADLERVPREIESDRRDSGEFRIGLPMDGFPSDGLMTATILAR
jgi:hypothetical protein